MRYVYTFTIDDFECDCYSVNQVVKVINERAKCAVVTADMINTIFTRPHKANKRLFATLGPAHSGQIKIERRRLPSKGEQAQAEIDKVNAMVQAMTAS